MATPVANIAGTPSPAAGTQGLEDNANAWARQWFQAGRDREGLAPNANLSDADKAIWERAIATQYGSANDNPAGKAQDWLTPYNPDTAINTQGLVAPWENALNAGGQTDYSAYGQTGAQTWPELEARAANAATLAPPGTAAPVATPKPIAAPVAKPAVPAVGQGTLARSPGGPAPGGGGVPTTPPLVGATGARDGNKPGLPPQMGAVRDAALAGGTDKQGTAGMLGSLLNGGNRGQFATALPSPESWVPQSTWWSPSQRQMTFTPQQGNTGGTGPLLGQGGTGTGGRPGQAPLNPISTTPGLLPGHSPATIGGQPVAGGVNTQGSGPGGTEVDNLFGSEGVRSGPVDTNPAWDAGKIKPTQQIPWHTYSFDKPANDVQVNFNALMKTNPIIAYKYLTTASGGNDMKTLFAEKGQPMDTANYVANAFMEPRMVNAGTGGPGSGGNADFWEYLGLEPGSIPWTLETGANNQIMAGGKSVGTLPVSDTWYQRLSDPRGYASKLGTT